MTSRPDPRSAVPADEDAEDADEARAFRTLVLLELSAIARRDG